MKQFGYSSLGSELKKQTGIAKYFYKLFKDQINVNGIKTEDGFRTEQNQTDIIAYASIKSPKHFPTIKSSCYKKGCDH